MNIAIITGASSGIGREFAMQLNKLEQFDEIWLIARRVQKMESLSKELNVKTKILALDLTKVEDIEKFNNELENEKPNIRYLINSSGYGKFGTYDEVSLTDSSQMIDLNCKSLVLLTLYSLKYMSKGSHVINMGSASSFFPLPFLNVYASTKAFVVHYSHGLYEELKPKGISVTVVSPGWVRTEFFDRADNNEHVHGPKYYKPMYEAKDVVRKALKDARRNKKESVLGAYTRFHRFGGRFFPRKLMTHFWKKMQKR